MLTRTLLFALLIFLPGAVLAAAAVWFGVRGTLKLGLVMMAGIAIPGYVLFWVYLASAGTGYVVSELLPYALAGVLIFFLTHFSAQQRRRLVPLLVPFLLTFFAALGVLSLGFLYGGKLKPIETAQTRFSHTLPPDNFLPLLFAEGLRKGSVPSPLLGDWLSSDRPPLQTGIVVALTPFMRPERMDYEIACVILQCLWVFAVWLLLRAFRLSRLSGGLVIGTIYLSGFALVNSFYVWPKLLAAAYLVAFAVPILALRPAGKRRTWQMRGLWAFLLASSLLAHGGTIFALIGILFFTLSQLSRTVILESFVAGLLAILLYCPWTAYQKYIDPPGDRLMKWHLAGMVPVNKMPVLAAIREAYRKQTFPEWKFAKETNTSVMFGHEGAFAGQLGFSARSLKDVRVEQFFFLMPAIGFVGVGFIGVVNLRNGKERRAARRLLLCSFLAAVVNVLLLFMPTSSTVQSTSHAMVLMAMTAAILGFRAALPKVAVVVCLGQCVWSWIVYEPDLRTLTVPGFQPEKMIGGMMALHVFALCGFAGLLLLSVWKAPAQKAQEWLQVGQLQLMESRPFKNCRTWWRAF